MQLDAEGNPLVDREIDVGKPQFKNFRSPDPLYTAPTGKGRQGILRSGNKQASRKADADKYRFKLTEALKTRKGRELLKEEIERIEAKVAKKYAGPGAIPSHTLENPESFKAPQEEIKVTTTEPKRVPERIKVKARGKAGLSRKILNEPIELPEGTAAEREPQRVRVMRLTDIAPRTRLSDEPPTPPIRIKVAGGAQPLTAAQAFRKYKDAQKLRVQQARFTRANQGRLEQARTGVQKRFKVRG